MPQLPPPDPNEQNRRYFSNDFIQFGVMVFGVLVLSRACYWTDAISPEMLRQGRTEMVRYAARGNEGYVRKFLDAGMDANVVDKYGETALQRAAVLGHTEVVRLLLERGARPDIANRSGCTPLMLAERRGHTEIAQLLRQAGAADLPKDACCKACSQKK